MTIALFVVGFAYWANTAVIAGAVITSGAFVASGENKIVQHLEGGVIREILVHEGDVVEVGQVLIRLDQTAPKAELDRLVMRYMRAKAIEARLAAEIRQDAQLALPDDLTAKENEPDVAAMVGAQQMTFDAWRKNLQAEVGALENSILALQQRIKASEAQKQAVQGQLQLVEQELQSKSELLPKGLIRKSEILALQRARVGLQGEIAKFDGDIGEALEQIARTQQQIVGTRTAATKDAVEQLHQARAEIADDRERIRAQQNVLDRVDITAPVRGIVVKLRYHTPGGVIEPGKNIMEIVPLHADLNIEVRVRPQDIDHVKVGQDASVRLTALNRRTTPTLLGRVVYVSADALPEDASAIAGRDMYVVRVSLDANQPLIKKGFLPKPGMPAEVYIKTTERTFFEYLMQPIKDSMQRAFRES